MWIEYNFRLEDCHGSKSERPVFTGFFGCLAPEQPLGCVSWMWMIWGVEKAVDAGVGAVIELAAGTTRADA